jgi:hypothetical protein
MALIKAVHTRMAHVFGKGGTVDAPLTREDYDTLIDTFEKSAEFKSKELKGEVKKKSREERDQEFNLIRGFIAAASDLAAQYSAEFEKLTGGDPKCIGYSDFVREIHHYMQGVEDESDDRIKGAKVEQELFERRRFKTSAVFTVYLAALLESGLKINKDSMDRNSHIEELKQDFCQIVCRFNAGFSAKRESGTPNWVSNDLYIFRQSGGTYELSRDVLFEKINTAMVNAEINMGRLDPKDIEVLLFAAILQQWGIGSIPAQMVTGRYDKDREGGPYLLRKDNGLRVIPENIWTALTPRA